MFASIQSNGSTKKNLQFEQRPFLHLHGTNDRSAIKGK